VTNSLQFEEEEEKRDGEGALDLSTSGFMVAVRSAPPEDPAAKGSEM
jgi:hypothetical protein